MVAMKELTKWCPGCDLVKPLDLWGTHKSTPDGYQYRCKDCKAREMRINRERNRRAEDIARAMLMDRHREELQTLVATVKSEMKEGKR